MKLKLPLGAALLLCLLTSACIPQGGQKRQPGELERLGAQPLDAQVCEAPRAGTLGVHDGGVWFQDEAMRAKLAAPEQGERRRGWEPEEVLVVGMGSGWGQLVPHPGVGQLVATRGAAWDVEQERQTAPAQLVTIDAATLAIKPWWNAPDGVDDLRLLGRLGATLVVLTMGDQGKAQRVWALVPEQAEPLGQLDLVAEAGAPVGPPASGLVRWPVMGQGGDVFLVDVGPAGQITGGAVKTEARSMVRASATDLILYFADNTCALASLDAPESWAALPRSVEACNKVDAGWERPVLDGAPVAARIDAAPSGCKVQHRIILPPLPDLPAGEDAMFAGRVAIAQLPPTPDDARERLLIRATTLSASIALADESSVQTVSAPTFALALPLEALTIELVRIDGQAFWELRLDLDIPYEPWPACAAGQLIFEAAEATDAPWRRAVIRQYVEFGKCE